MTRRVVFHQLAERELNEAAAYYHEARPGLGAVFLEAVERTVLRAAATPSAGHPVSEILRRLIVPKFPFLLIYRLCGEDLRVLAVANTKHRPFCWRSRR